MINNKIEFSLIELIDLTVTAFEGGSNYWLKGVYCERPEHCKFMNTAEFIGSVLHGTSGIDSFQVVFEIDNDEPEYTKLSMTAKDLRQNLRLFYQTEHKTKNQVLNDGWDASTADDFLQFILFKKQIYA